jgi:hypothetical protein
MSLLTKLIGNPKCKARKSAVKLTLLTATVKNGSIDCRLRGNDHFHSVFFRNSSLKPIDVEVYRTSRNNCVEYDRSQNDPNGCTAPSNPNYGDYRDDNLRVPAGKQTPRFLSDSIQGEKEHCINLNVCDDSQQSEKILVEFSYDNGVGVYSDTANLDVDLVTKQSIS